MPDRYVREALLGSSAWQSLSDAETQLLFLRILLIADDFGCYDGRLGVIATNVFPTHPLGEEELTDLERMMNELYAGGLIIRYSNAGKPYIAIWQWGNDLRGNRKFPAPPVDVDVEGLKVRGKFGKDIGWTNPPGCDPVSILLDSRGRAVVPQPPEWRPPDHLRPNPKSKVGWRRESVTVIPPVTGSTPTVIQLQAASDTLPVTGGLTQAASDRLSSLQTIDSRTPVADVAVARAQPPPVTTAAATPTNGAIIEFKNGSFIGLSEEQRVKWQGMWDDLRIPDEIDHAAAWLAVHPAECAAIERQGLGFGQFLVRWLLRESRSRRTAAGS